MRTLPDDRSGTYTQALQLLNSMQKSPSCNRLAASTLLESCQTVDGSTPGMEENLEDIKSTYAARLALCEISSTGLVIPPDCRPLIPADNLEGKVGLEWIIGIGGARSAAFGNVGHRQLSQCLRSLESRPQWWTSYSNSRQNAVIMCQAARVDIERGKFEQSLPETLKTYAKSDEFIKLHKSMAESTSHMKDALLKALDNAAIQLTQQEKFAVTVKDLQHRVLKDSQSYFTKFMESVDTAMQLMLGKWNTETKNAGLELNKLQDVIAPRKTIRTLSSV